MPDQDHGNAAERTRDGGGRYAIDPATAERDAEAARLAREGLTYQEIADELGMANRGVAWRAVARCRAEVRKEAGEELIAVERAELDRLYVAACEIIETQHIAVSNGRVVRDDDGTPIHDDGPRVAAIGAARQIRESYRKLLGLDQPAKQEISGGVKYEVVGISTEDLA